MQKSAKNFGKDSRTLAHEEDMIPQTQPNYNTIEGFGMSKQQVVLPTDIVFAEKKLPKLQFR